MPTEPSRDVDQRPSSTEPAPATSDLLPAGWWRRRRDHQAFTRAKQVLEWPMLVLAIVFVVALVVGETGNLDGNTRATVLAVNVAIWLAFTAEYLWLLRLAPERGRFVRTHLLDLLVILVPFLRPLRAFRAVRALRLIRLLRVVTVATRSWQQIVAVMRHRGLGGILVIVLALLMIGGLVAYALEPNSFSNVGDAIWWVPVTSTTVGYGDFAPVGIGARTVAVVIMILGVGLVGLITANIVDFLMGQAARDEAGRDDHTSGGASSVDASTPTACTRCEDTADRLHRIEEQLERLVAAAHTERD